MEEVKSSRKVICEIFFFLLEPTWVWKLLWSEKVEKVEEEEYKKCLEKARFLLLAECQKLKDLTLFSCASRKNNKSLRLTQKYLKLKAAMIK